MLDAPIYYINNLFLILLCWFQLDLSCHYFLLTVQIILYCLISMSCNNTVAPQGIEMAQSVTVLINFQKLSHLNLRPSFPSDNLRVKLIFFCFCFVISLSHLFSFKNLVTWNFLSSPFKEKGSWIHFCSFLFSFCSKYPIRNFSFKTFIIEMIKKDFTSILQYANEAFNLNYSSIKMCRKVPIEIYDWGFYLLKFLL